MALTLTGITCAYEAARADAALSDVTWTLRPGELVLVVGRTGAGKTTMLRVASGLMRPSAGEALVDGAPVAGRGSAPGAVGLVFQRAEAQFFAPSVGEDCMFGPLNLGRTPEQARRDAHEALDAVGLPSAAFAPREPWSLSGGQARRAAIAGVLAMRPRYLLLDEPTAGLDAAGRRAVLAAIRTARAGAGCAVVTHDPEVFLSEADRVVAMAAGRIVHDGPASGYLDATTAPGAPQGMEPPDVARLIAAARRRGVALPAGLTDPAAIADALLGAVR